MPPSLVISEIPLEDIVQMAYNKTAFEGWKSYAIEKSQKK